MYILLLWTELGSSGVLDCTVDHRLLFFHVQNIAGWPYQKKKTPNLLPHCWMGLTFFCHFLVPCWYLLLCCVCRMGHWDLFMPHTLWCLPSPTTAVPSPGPLQEFPSRGGEVSLCSVTDMQDQFCFVSRVVFIKECCSLWGGKGSFIAWSVRVGLPLSCCFAGGFGFFSGHVLCGRELFLTYSLSLLKMMNLLSVHPHL